MGEGGRLRQTYELPESGLCMQDPLARAKELESKYAKQPKHNAKLEKGPRHYADEILSLPESERTEALGKVPPHLFTWVCQYVNDPTHETRTVNSIAAKIAKLKGRENRVAALEKVPSELRQNVKQTVIAMMNAKLERAAIQNEQ